MFLFFSDSTTSEKLKFDIAVQVFSRIKLIELYKKLNFMPWMFFNIMKLIDTQMKCSIKKQILSRKLKAAPKKAYYTYLLLDNEKFQSARSKININSLLPSEANIKDFIAFKNSIFYVGKGIFNRKHQHLTLAKKLYCGVLPLKKVQLKISKIASLWKRNRGVTLIQLDCDATTYEALTRENCIIKSLNFNKLTNRIRGTSYGDAKHWSSVKVVNYGDMLLYQLFNNYLTKEPSVIYARDVVLKTKSTKKPRICSYCKKNINLSI